MPKFKRGRQWLERLMDNGQKAIVALWLRPGLSPHFFTEKSGGARGQLNEPTYSKSVCTQF